MDTDSAIGKKVEISPKILDTEECPPYMSQKFRDTILGENEDYWHNRKTHHYWYMTRLANYDGVVVTHPVHHFSQILSNELVKYYVMEV